MERPLVWVDLEMTGLDPERDVIVEVAVIVTDGALETTVEGPDLVIGQPDEKLDQMVEVVRDMHEKSGLTEAIRRSEVTVTDAERQVLSFIAEHVPDQLVAPLAGNSVHADRMFLRAYMPQVESHLHYRNVDVSTIKELAKRWRPDAVASAPTKDGGHRALADIRESIAELRHYRDAIFGPPSDNGGTPGAAPDAEDAGPVHEA
ncbi:oligoribonuclease [Egibacter rhizosphaerae]|uniref:Oligoribonuclease n=1 Tax=Egibacter rhizosphaerae TaxID=1670831 RepID=A0A411YLG5_9ACTN|nr:oligoribonuclease [Egibacter rhizosphaerae]